MKIKKYWQFISENKEYLTLEQEDLEEHFIFLHDLDLEYSVETHWLPDFKEYQSETHFDIGSGYPGEDKLFIFDHEYSYGFDLSITGKIKPAEWRDFYVNFASTLNYLKSEGYEWNGLSDLDPEKINRYLECILENDTLIKLPNNLESLKSQPDFMELRNKIYSYLHIINTTGQFEGWLHISLNLYFSGPATKKITAQEMAELYKWSYQKSDGKNVWIKVTNDFLVDNILGVKNDYYQILSSEDDIDWAYYYEKFDFEGMASYTSKNISDRLRSILKSDEKGDSRLWKEFRDKYPNEYGECNEILSDMYCSEMAFQQREGIRDSWVCYLQDIFTIERIEGEEDQWLVQVDSKWFNYDEVGDYSGFEDVLYNYVRDIYYPDFNPKYSEYPDISYQSIEEEWLPILNKIKIKN